MQEILSLDVEQCKEVLEKQVNDLKNEVESLAESTEAAIKYSIYIRLAEAEIAVEKYNDAINTLNLTSEETKTKQWLLGKMQ